MFGEDVGRKRRIAAGLLLRLLLSLKVLLIVVTGDASASFAVPDPPELKIPHGELDLAEIADYNEAVRVWLHIFNKEFEIVKHEEASAAWNASVSVSVDNQDELKTVERFKQVWSGRWCEKAEAIRRNSALLSSDASRQLWIMCRGPRYTGDLSRRFEQAKQDLYRIYHTAEVCSEDDGRCEHGEPDLARRMEDERDPVKLRRIWKSWREAVGNPKTKALYRDMVGIMNEAAERNGYGDIGDAWREQLDIPDIGEKIAELHGAILPFYRLLHGYVRHRLLQFYGRGHVSPDGPMPAHLLGNMWAQSWNSIIDIIAPGPYGQSPSLTAKLRKRNYSVIDMVRSSDDFFRSLGLDPMPKEFWQRSQFLRPRANESTSPPSCHPSALNLYSGNDFRIEMCGDISEETFLTAHHEMGHVQYYMSYSHQPTIFRDGANPAFHEAVGDSINYAVQSPAHLSRLGLMRGGRKSSLGRMLSQALHRIPLIMWSLVVDLWRWDVFSGRVAYEDWNKHWWRLREDIQGLKAPVERNESNFDPMAKFHIPDNTPYMPYFFSSFLQVQIFEGMCKAKYGPHLPSLNGCDLYGSKAAGTRLRNMMSLGQSRPWQRALEEVSREGDISARPLLDYYKPLIQWLERQVRLDGIPIGW